MNESLNENQEKGNKKKSFTSDTKDIIKKILGFMYHRIKIVLIAVIIFTVFVLSIYFGIKGAIQARVNTVFSDMEQMEKNEVTIVQIESKLEQVGQISTCVYEYTDEKKVTNTRAIFGLSIPGTTNSVDIIFSGVIKVGYDIEDIDYELNKAFQKIYIKLPDPYVIDNYIKLDNLSCKDGNNILNPIGTDNIINYFEEIEQEELNKAIEKGIYEKAEQQIQSIIINYLSEFNDYEVEFR